jgi:hypothetical protein
MDSKSTLCRTLLEEVESQLARMITEAGENDARAVQLTNVLGHVRKAIIALDREGRAKRKSAGGS